MYLEYFGMVFSDNYMYSLFRQKIYPKYVCQMLWWKGFLQSFFYVYNLVLTFLAAEYKYSHFFKFHIRVIKYQDWRNNTCKVLHFKFNFHQSIYSRPSKDTCIIIIYYMYTILALSFATKWEWTQNLIP